MCKCFERELILDLVKSEKKKTFGVVKIPFKKVEVGGDVKYPPLLGIQQESQEAGCKREGKIFVIRKQSQAPGGICQYLTQFLQNKLSLWPIGKQPRSDFFDLGGGSLLWWSAFSSWDSKKRCCLAHSPGITGGELKKTGIGTGVEEVP